MRFVRVLCAVLVSALLPVAVGIAAGEEVHVAPTGDDANPGTAERPVASVARAVALVKGRAAAQEIVIHEGVYHEAEIVVGADGKPDHAPPSLLIRPGRKPDGGFEEVLFDGATPIVGADPLPDFPGVFKITGASVPAGHRKFYRIDEAGRLFLDPRYGCDLFELDTRIRYAFAADVAAVKARPAAYIIARKSYGDYYPDVFFHTSDGRPPKEHALFLARAGVGLSILWPNVTVQGLRFRNFLLRTSSGGVSLEGKDQTAADCRVWNSGRAFGVGEAGVNARILRCRGEDIASGVKSYGRNTTVEDCVFIRRNGPFEVPDYTQDQSGIHVYYPGQAAEIRRNVVVGFQTGIFIKAQSQSYVFEHNTVVAADQPLPELGIGCTKWHPETVCRFNIVTGYDDPIPVGGQERGLGAAHLVAYNCLVGSGREDRMKLMMDRLRECKEGDTNIAADPRFAAALKDDYRLLPDSPAAARAPGNKPLGACPVVPKDWADPQPPQVRLAVAPPAAAVEADGGPATRPVWVVRDRAPKLLIQARDNATAARQMRIRLGGAPWGGPEPFAEEKAVALPPGAPRVVVGVSVADEAGNWSNEKAVDLYVCAEPPVLAGTPVVYANKHGIVMCVETAVPCEAQLEWGPDTRYGAKLAAVAPAVEFVEGGDDWEAVRAKTASPYRLRHQFALTTPDLQAGRAYHGRVVLKDAGGGQGMSADFAFTASGEPGVRYVAPDGKDEEGRGGPDAPWRTIQFAADRVLPGELVLIRNGLYTGPVFVRRGGIEGAPIVLQAQEQRQAVLDGGKAVDRLIVVRGASHVVIEGLELRWFKANAIGVFDSADVSVRHCTIWNEPWLKGGRHMGNGLTAQGAPRIEVDHTVFFAQNRAILLNNCPGFRVTHNTATSLTHGCITLYHATPNGVIRNNSFTFTSNYHYTLVIGDEDRKTLDCDYNNVALFLREDVHKNVPAEEVLRRADDDFIYFFWGQKAVAYINGNPPKPVCSLKEWRERFGYDRHSIMARPLYVDPWNRDFRLRPGSPNIGAGKDGATIGALGVAAKEQR